MSTPSIMLLDTEQEDVSSFLPKLEEALDRAGNTHTPKDVFRRVMSGKAQLWIEGEGLIITEIETYPSGQVINFWLASGDLEDCLSMLPRIYEWGKDIGCYRATTLARKGWQRVLRDEGWEAAPLVFLTKEL